ncbi:MAG TPA: recombinase, partial [Lactococcus sp.]|nr:recombinase [Lactococcus sp.]
GSEQITKILEADKILTPAHYHLKNGSKRVPTSVDPYHWASTTVAKILCSREYCGDVVNLKTYSTSYKDKKRKKNTVENMVILQDVHEAIIDRSYWEYIQHKQNLHKMRRKSGKQSLFS